MHLVEFLAGAHRPLQDQGRDAHHLPGRPAVEQLLELGGEIHCVAMMC